MLVHLKKKVAFYLLFNYEDNVKRLDVLTFCFCVGLHDDDDLSDLGTHNLSVLLILYN